jgi:hypothetical protein
MKSRLHTILVLFLYLYAGPIKAQSPITAFSAGYQSTASSINSYNARPATGSNAFGSCTNTSFTYTFSNGASNQYKLNSFNANGSTFLVAPAASSTVRLRRVNNAQVTGARNIVYMETTSSTANACPSSSTLNFKPPYIDTMENLLAAGMLNQGTDNIFTNAGNGDGNNNNIERVDVIFPTGLNTASPTRAGFAIFDRGGNNAHDPFRIVAITSLDARGDPNGFGSVKTCTGGNGSNNGNWGHPTTANGNKQIACYVMRKDAGDPYLRASSNINQELGGVFYSFADLGITSGQTLYGYALLGPDGTASPTSAQLLDLNNTSVYPTTTTESSGGLDLVAVNTVFQTGSYVVLSLPPAKPTPQPNDPAPITSWRVFPTMPHQGQLLTVQAPHDGSYSLSFYNTSGIGRTISIQVHAGQAAITPPAIPGLYWLQLTSAEGRLIPGSGQVLIR